MLLWSSSRRWKYFSSLQVSPNCTSEQYLSKCTLYHYIISTCNWSLHSSLWIKERLTIISSFQLKRTLSKHQCLFSIEPSMFPSCQEIFFFFLQLNVWASLCRMTGCFHIHSLIFPEADAQTSLEANPGPTFSTHIHTSVRRHLESRS